MALTLVLIAIALAAGSGLPALALPRASLVGQRTAAGAMCLAAILGLSGALASLTGAETDGVPLAFLPWPDRLRVLGDGCVALDALSAFFLVPVLLMGALGSLYGLGYWPQDRHSRNARKLQLFWGLLVAGMAFLVVARHALVFLLGWEVMALAGFLLVTTEDQREESRRAGFIYLLGTHAGTLTLFALFALWQWATGSFELVPAAAGSLGPGVQGGLFLLALFSFGFKAGIMPLHFWLPGAHANAPSHVSAMLSGVVLKMGIYGIVRFFLLLPDLPGIWGGLVLTLGAVSGLLGVVFAIGQHDLKRLLAYHSVENIGIILMGLGLAMLGRATGRPEWLVLGLSGCLLHVWNHSFFKSLLFFCAGSVDHGARTRQLDQLGGLSKNMPWTASLFLVGAVAICGLPPLNGFVSELFVYLGLFKTVTGSGSAGGAAMIAVPVLAMIGALAVSCFVKVYGGAFLGEPRSQAATNAHEAPALMRWPMLCLAGLGLLLGLGAPLVLETALRVLTPALPGAMALGAPLVAGLYTASLIFALLLALLAGLFVLRRALLRGRDVRTGPTWDCGYIAPTARIQYTYSSFAQPLALMFQAITGNTGRATRPWGLFPARAGYFAEAQDRILTAFLALFEFLDSRLEALHRLQQGQVHVYVLYIAATLVALLAWGLR